MFSRVARLSSLVLVALIAAASLVFGQNASSQASAPTKGAVIAQVTESAATQAVAAPTAATNEPATKAPAPAKKPLLDSAVSDSILEPAQGLETGDSVVYDIVTYTIKHQRQILRKSVDTMQLIRATDYGVIATQNVITQKYGQVRTITIGTVAGQPIFKIHTTETVGKPQASKIYIGTPAKK